MARRLHCPTTIVTGIWVEVANGQELKCDSMCKNFQWGMQQQAFQAEQQQWNALRSLLKQYEDVFQEPKGLPPQRIHDHRIPIKPGSQPVNARPYRYASMQKTVIEDMVRDMLMSRVIQNSFGPYASLVVLVKKKDNTWGMCIDYRSLNNIIVKDKFFIPLIEKLLEELGAGVQTDPKKVIAVQSWSIPQNWIMEAQHAFGVLKQALVNAPVLSLSKFSKIFIVKTDASGEGIGAVLMQEGHPIAYISKALSAKNMGLSAYEEMLAILFAVKQIAARFYLSSSLYLAARSVTTIWEASSRWRPFWSYCYWQMKNKYENVASPGSLQPLPHPQGIFTDITMDFIDGLPKSQGRTVIMVVVDRLTKYAHFIGLTHPYTAKSMAQLFLDHVFKFHGLPNTIVSDKDAIFTNQFW
ncbi:uncharacterized protein [Elaeis guineensis]|uniref:uncharacterized protein n=1 Tax=Elaeis guineensis var. tenera TaxID=51953 RepID=UPI003C6D9DD5